ncbi:putative cystathionine gamma-synthase [Phaeomoniella chlamydospora]|uniref:Putative cystathionine gamma-synthase n=1 Tax=Phaeomoniella chlamydospora TaxID=158046 RepID=A0A0G2G192_PHACM|nr:putative cystathionine gamma-synthase [Phaeomoniella chlamydospora]
MSAIYYVHTYLLYLNQFPSKPVLFGFPFQSTPDVFRLFGPGLKWFPLGTEIDELDTHLISERSQGRRVPAVWTEFPSNPLLVSSDLHRLRALANEHGFLLIVDDTVGSFCNIDVLPVADIVVTSLTKSFSGYADVLGGSAVLNPNSRHYPTLQGLFQRHYHNDLHPLDATVLLNNSDDYLKRSAILNRNAQSLISLLHTNFTTSSTTPIKSLYYPSLPPTSQNYTTFLRPATPDFPSPGYGCLFSIEFTSLPALIAFLDNLHVHQGPHLGAHRTLAMPYVKAIFNDKMDEYEKYGVNERMLRISAGLEDDAELHRAFTFALEKAEEAVRTGKPVGKSVGDVERDGLDGSVEGGSMKGDSMLVAGDEVDVVNVT